MQGNEIDSGDKILKLHKTLIKDLFCSLNDKPSWNPRGKLLSLILRSNFSF